MSQLRLCRLCGAAGRKPGAQKPSDGPAPKKLFMDMLGPLLGGNSSKQPAAITKEMEAEKMARCASHNSGLTEYVNKMKISETGKRSKLSNESTASSCSQMSVGSAVSPIQRLAHSAASAKASEPSGSNGIYKWHTVTTTWDCVLA